MNKEEMIEEMARIIGWSYDTRSIDCGECDGDCDDDCCEGVDDCNECKARDLYNLGYRKIPEGSVVLSKEEYKELKDEIKRLDQDRLELQVDNNMLYLQLDNKSKETAKAILQLILNESGIDILGNCYKLPTRTFNKIKRQFGVEVEE